MANPARNKNRNKLSGSRKATLIVLFLVISAVAGYFLLLPAKKTGEPQHKPMLTDVKPVVPGSSTIPQTGMTKPLPDVSQPLPTVQKEPPPQTVLPKTKKPGLMPGTSGRLAIIIDDMGSSIAEVRSLAAINVPLTFAIIPGLRADKEVAAYAASHNFETMIHVPMQSKGWPTIRLEANGLLVSMAEDDLQEMVSGFISQFPGAVGVNNHMGSEFTEQEDKMVAVLQVLKKKNLFFIDSVTSPKSVGLRMAQKIGVKSARRNVFLDNEQKRSYILGQLNQAVRLARKNGSAIAICHPHPATIAALSAALPELAGQGVQLVPVSLLVK